jgi:hypothetical protein
MKKSITWIHTFGPQMASFRYRAAIPAKEVAKINGYSTFINEGEADVVVFSKPIRETLPLAEKAKKDGAKIVVDFADDHFTDIEAETYRQFAGIGDAFVTASPVMRGRLYDYIKKDSAVIPDPYEFPESEPHANGDNFLWFGHIRNFSELTKATNFLGDRKLRVVTGPKEIPNTIPWSMPNLAQAFSLSNIVILPTKVGAEYKSPNRLLNSLRAGCFVVAMDHPAYKEFRDFAWVGNFPTGLKWADAFKESLDERVQAGQDYIRDKYSPEAIGQQWASFLEAL